MAGRRSGWAMAAVVVLACVVGAASQEDGGGGGGNLKEECRGDVDKLKDCIAYATGREEEPTEGCCEKVTEIRNSRPECLCYIIQKANCGRQVVFSMVLQIQRLMSLPQACNLQGFNNISICPALLGLPAGSPDYAIFNGSAPSQQSTTCETSAGHFIGARNFGLAVFSAIISSIFSF